MSKLISKAYRRAYAGQTINMPLVGEVEFNEDGSLDIDDDKAEGLIAATKESFDFEIEADPEKDKEPESDDVKEAKELLNNATTKQLLEMAAEAKLGKPEKIAAWTDEKLKAELLKKLVAPVKK